jgi:uncharacterized membrane protein YhaH (DUF805 family)
MTFETLYANPMGRTARGPYVGALITLLAAVAFYLLLASPGLNREWVLVTLLFPGMVLHARRLHDMGQTAWLLLAPGALIAAAVTMHMTHRKLELPMQPAVALAAYVVSAGFIAWCLLGKGRDGANRFGTAA